MLNGRANFLNFKEICYKNVKFRNHLPLRDSKSVRYIRKFVICEFVITVKFWRFVKNFTRNSKKLRYIRGFAKFVFVLNEVYCMDPVSYLISYDVKLKLNFYHLF